MKTLRLDPTKVTTKVLDYLESLIWGQPQVRDMDYRGRKSSTCVYRYRNSPEPTYLTAKQLYVKLIGVLELQHGDIKVILGAAEYSFK